MHIVGRGSFSPRPCCILPAQNDENLGSNRNGGLESWIASGVPEHAKLGTVTETPGTPPHFNEAATIQHLELAWEIPLCQNAREGDIEGVDGLQGWHNVA